MSSKTKKQKGIQPRLRFPEFRDAGDWEPKKLGEIVELVTEKAGDRKYTLMSITSGVGLVSQMEKFGREIAGAAYKNYFVIRNNDFAYNKSATKEYPEGYIAMYSGENEGAVPNSIFTCFRIKDSEVVPKFLDYQFVSNLHGKWLKNFLTIGARAHGSLNIDNNDLLSLPVPMPKGKVSKREQQKIADCLSSLDELIEAEDAKLDALQQHKKGLMQELFPAEGETLPKRRFPEFKDAPEWEIKPLGKVADVLQGYGFPEKHQGNMKGAYPFYKVSDISNSLQKGEIFIKEAANYIDEATLKILKAKLLPVGTTIFAKIGEAIRLNRRTMTTVPCLIDNNVAGLKGIESEATDLFVYYTMLRINLADHSGGAVPSVNKTTVEGLLVTCPDIPEQQMITDCLCSIDELISSQSQKLDALRDHKKGLMQQLFPILSNESEG